MKIILDIGYVRKDVCREAMEEQRNENNVNLFFRSGKGTVESYFSQIILNFNYKTTLSKIDFIPILRFKRI